MAMSADGFASIGQSGMKENYKRAAYEPVIPQSKAQLQDYHSLHLVFTMMLYNLKPLISLVAVFAAASGVSSTAVPVARGASDGGYPPPKLTSVSQCNTGSVQCCNTFTSTNNPLVGILSGILGVVADPSLGVGITCLPIIGSTQW
jgi:Fungal hydrophobin